MRFCVDVQAAVARPTGVGRYVQQLVGHLAPEMGTDELLGFCFDARGKALPTSDGIRRRRVRWCPGRVARGMWKVFHWPPFEVFSGRADLYHFPNFILPPLRKTSRAVVTVHDLSFLRYPEFAEARNLQYLCSSIRETVARAEAIITDAASIRAEVCEHLDVPSERVHAIHLGIGPEFKPATESEIAAMRSSLGLERPYLLCVGTVEPRKNHRFLVDVFERLKGFDGDLVIAGAPGWKVEPIFERFATSPLRDRIRYLRYVPDDKLPALYSAAEVFVLASHYEGFGFPPLEAMACGTPVFSSVGGSLAEVLGSAAVTCSHFDLDGWCSELSELLHDDIRRNELISDGRNHAAGFTWQRTALETLAVYRKVAGQ